MNSKAFLGKGWRYPVDTNRNGTVAMSAFEDLVRESIIIILGTAPGERVMRPHFGCEIHDLLFAPNNANTAGLAAGKKVGTYILMHALRPSPKHDFIATRVNHFTGPAKHPQ